MRFGVMIEGQEDVGWADWQRLARTSEQLGFESLFRSDHYLSVMLAEPRGALDAWTTLAALAASTTTLRLGTLVSPATFRHPSTLAKSVVTVDHVSGGRAELGLGAGWMEAEHRAYGFAFPELRVRLDQLAEQLEIVRGSWAPGPFTFHGVHYAVDDLDALPKPFQRPHPPLIVGGRAGARSADLAARHATEYNVFHMSAQEAKEARGRLETACERVGRDPATLGFSLMNGFVVGEREDEVRRRAQRIASYMGGGRGSEAIDNWLVGSPEQIVEQLSAYADAGVRRVMLQHHLFDDDEALELIATRVAPALAAR